MGEIQLRDYQINQLDFIENKIKYVNTVAVESPTGSGKTYVMLEFVKHWFQDPEHQLTNVVISTGFNNLVFLLEKKAKEFGLNPKVLIGTKACNCPKKMEELGLDFKVFTENNEGNCGDEHKYLDVENKSKNYKVCPYTKDAYLRYFNEITSNVGQVIITNHSSLLVHQKSLENTSLLIIDEAHTFSMFYDGYVRLELDKQDLIEIDEAISKVKEPMRTIIKMNMSRGVKIPSVQLQEILKNIDNYSLRSRTEEFFETDPNYGNYIERTNYNFVINRFYKTFDLEIQPRILLMSATLDDFTLNMFQVRSSNFYREYKVFCDYSKSEFIAIPDENFAKALSKFMNYIDGKNLNTGLILSTTITDMNTAINIINNDFNQFKVFDIRNCNIEEFESYKGKKVLIGSRGLFQGIDIADLDFVALNKIPFPNWDDKAKAQQDFLTDHGKNNFDPWKQFTIPKTENDIIQSTGRLWRSIDSKGIVSIFDPRVEKFKYIFQHTMDRYRHGIKSLIMKDDSITEFKISKS